MNALSFGQATRTIPRSVSQRISRRDLGRGLINELLQRDETFNSGHTADQIVGGRTVLVTGAGGSIGTELCWQIAAAGPRRLLLLDKSENSLFYAHLNTAEQLGADRVKPYLADLLDRDQVRAILRREKPEIIFHAAAYKHVAMLELHPQEAIRNNVLGTRNVAEGAIEGGVGQFVNISTDKAVAPSNYMGLSKKLTEMCIQGLAGSLAPGGARFGDTRFANVRFGNVAGSTGSVLRLFWDRIQKGGPVRVTDPRATRYFMSVSEAVYLILHAAALADAGETFVFDMGEPLNIYDLAKKMTLLAGLEPGVDIRIEFTGLQAGEKLIENLQDEWEHPIPTEACRILAIHEKHARAGESLIHIGKMEELLACSNIQGLMQYIRELFPEFGKNHPGEIPLIANPSEIDEMISIGAA